MVLDRILPVPFSYFLPPLCTNKTAKALPRHIGLYSRPLVKFCHFDEPRVSLSRRKRTKSPRSPGLGARVASLIVEETKETKENRRSVTRAEGGVAYVSNYFEG